MRRKHDLGFDQVSPMMFVKVGPAHVELRYSEAKGEPIWAGCHCLVSRKHTYREWVDRFRAGERPAAVLRPTRQPAVMRSERS